MTLSQNVILSGAVIALAVASIGMSIVVVRLWLFVNERVTNIRWEIDRLHRRVSKFEDRRSSAATSFACGDQGGDSR